MLARFTLVFFFTEFEDPLIGPWCKRLMLEQGKAALYSQATICQHASPVMAAWFPVPSDFILIYKLFW